MKRIVKLTESDLTRIVKRAISENIEDNDLYRGINKMLFNSNASNEEQIQVLKYILQQKEGEGMVTKEKTDFDLSGLEALVQRVIKQRMDEDDNEDDLPEYIKAYNMYKNGEVNKKTFYSYVAILEKHEKEDLVNYMKNNG